MSRCPSAARTNPGKESPVFAHYRMALGRIVRDLEETERRIRTETAIGCYKLISTKI